MNLHRQYLTENDCYRAAGKLKPRGVMVHSTAANNPYIRRYVQPDDGILGRNERGNDWNRPGVGKCVHAFIGKTADGSIATYQTLPWTMRAWHCGGSGNNTHISFEICEDDLKSAAYFNAVYREAVEFTAYLCGLFGLAPLEDGVVICHKEGARRGVASNHGDVEHWFPRFGKTMDDFRRNVADEMEEKMTKTQILEAIGDKYIERFEDLPEWAKPDVQELLDQRVIEGATPCDVDPDDIGMFLSDIRTLISVKRMLGKDV